MCVYVCVLIQVCARYIATRCWHSTVFRSSYPATHRRLRPAAAKCSSPRTAASAVSSPSQDPPSSAAGVSRWSFQAMSWSWCLSLRHSTASSLWLMVRRCVSARLRQLYCRLSSPQGNRCSIYRLSLYHNCDSTTIRLRGKIDVHFCLRRIGSRRARYVVVGS